MVPYRNWIITFVLMVGLVACTGVKPTESLTTTVLAAVTQLPTPTLTTTSIPSPTPIQPTQVPTLPPGPESSPTASATPSLKTVTLTPGMTATLGPDDWKQMPVLPTGVSQRVRLIYQMGLLKGNNPAAFSKVGDCNSTMPYFLSDFDNPGQYDLGEYTSLQETIDYFSGSFSRKSLAAKDGLTSYAALSTLWVDWKDCETYETPLTCEFRVQKPAFAILSFGTNDANGNVDFEIAFRRVIDMTIGSGVVPILSTKADNAEGDEAINEVIARVAYEYELPLWNYWLAVQPLPDKGLRSPEHLSASSVGYANFDGENLYYGWSMRNLTALQVLDMVWKSLQSTP